MCFKWNFSGFVEYEYFEENIPGAFSSRLQTACSFDHFPHSSWLNSAGFLNPIQFCLWIQLADHLLSGFIVLIQLNKKLAPVQSRSLVTSFWVRDETATWNLCRERTMTCYCPMCCHGNLSSKVYLLFWEAGISHKACERRPFISICVFYNHCIKVFRVVFFTVPGKIFF